MRPPDLSLYCNVEWEKAKSTGEPAIFLGKCQFSDTAFLPQEELPLRLRI